MTMRQVLLAKNNIVSEGEHVQTEPISGRSWCDIGMNKEGLSNLWPLPIDGESYNFTFNSEVISEWEYPVPAVLNHGHVTDF